MNFCEDLTRKKLKDLHDVGRILNFLLFGSLTTTNDWDDPNKSMDK
jgi:hypothetical protein